MHHILNKSKLRGNKSALRYVNSHADVFLTPVCQAHNVGRLADSKAAQAILLGLKCEELGADYVREVWDGIPWKVPQTDLSFEAVLAKAA